MAFIAPILEAATATEAATAVGAEAGAAAAEGTTAAAEGAGDAAAAGQVKNLSPMQFGQGGGKKSKREVPQVGGTPNDFNDPGYVS